MAGVLGVLGIAALPVASYAETDTDDVTVNVQVSSTLNLVCSGNYTHNYGPASNAADVNDGVAIGTTPTGTCAVTSNDAAGYTLTVASASTNTNLVHTVNSALTIPTAAGLPAAGTPAWAINVSNPQVDGTSGVNWLAMPASDATPITVATTSAAGNGSHPYSFATSIASTTASGTYSATVRFTATSN